MPRLSNTSSISEINEKRGRADGGLVLGDVSASGLWMVVKGATDRANVVGKGRQARQGARS